MSPHRPGFLPRISALLDIERLFTPPTSRFITPFETAIQELKERQTNDELRRRIEKYLKGDIPPHFNNGPVLYLARHIATPNFETLRFLHLTESVDIPAIIGQDVEDKFVPQNQLKKALGKPSVSLGITHKNGVFHEQFENICVVDFNKANGKKFSSIKTLWGEGLVDFHSRLFDSICKRPVTIVDDSEWIDRQCRGNLVEHYKRFLALFLMHGVLFEDFAYEDTEERRFKKKILAPAFAFLEREFGVRPLITQLNPTTVESPRFWVSYPKEVRDHITKSADTAASNHNIA